MRCIAFGRRRKAIGKYYSRVSGEPTSPLDKPCQNMVYWNCATCITYDEERPSRSDTVSVKKEYVLVKKWGLTNLWIGYYFVQTFPQAGSVRCGIIPWTYCCSQTVLLINQPYPVGRRILPIIPHSEATHIGTAHPRLRGWDFFVQHSP